jgi:phosphoadenosine phosphosulfate reductase
VSTELFHTVKTASMMTDSVIVGFSGGKDSVVTLDLCARYFKRVHPFFMYLVPGLSFQEAQIKWYERRYSVKIERIPHPMLSSWLKWGTFRKAHYYWPEITFNDVYKYMRLQTGCWWIAGGERIADSIVRRAMIKRSGSIDEKRGKIYPAAYFDKAAVMAYIKRHRLKMTPEYEALGYSFRGIEPQDMVKIRMYYPSDFERIKQMFPFVEAGIVKYENETSKV